MTTGWCAQLVEPSTSTWISKVAILKVTVLLNTESLTSNGRLGKDNEPICLLYVDRMDMYSCGHRIHHLRPNTDDLAACSPDTAHWSIDFLIQHAQNNGIYTGS